MLHVDIKDLRGVLATTDKYAQLAYRYVGIVTLPPHARVIEAQAEFTISDWISIVIGSITEDKDGQPHFGAVRFDTKSVQFLAAEHKVRVFFVVHASPGEAWRFGMMLAVA